MGFLAVLLLGALVYFVWRIVDQMPDVVFRLGEIQRDIGELRRQQERPNESTAAPLTAALTPAATNSVTAVSPPGMSPPASPPSITTPS